MNQSRRQSHYADALGQLRRNRLAMLALTLIAILVVVSVLASILPSVERHDPSAQDLDSLLQGPSSEHWLGTDTLGRDMWSRTLEGIRISLKVAVGAQLLILMVGVAIGTLCLIGGRRADAFLMRFTDLMYAFPELLAIILARSILRDQTWPIIGTGGTQLPGFPAEVVQVILAIAFVGWVTLARLVRGQLLSLRNAEFVQAAAALGASPARVVFLHMLPNTLGPIIVSVTFGIPAAIFAEATLGYLGIGVQAPVASLGVLISEGFTRYRSNPWMVISPALAVALITLCFTYLGDGVRDAFDPRSRRR